MGPVLCRGNRTLIRQKIK